MNHSFTAAINGFTAFFATNIDDILILLLLFSKVNVTLRGWHIVTGQYLGFTAIIIASLPGFVGGLIISRQWIGLLGLIPIAIGLSSLLNQEDSKLENVEAEVNLLNNSSIGNIISPQIYSVAAITFANGSDNISTYAPLFASSNWWDIAIILSIFFMMVGLWCYTAYRLTHLPSLPKQLTDSIQNFIPFIFIGLGVSIILGCKALSITKLIASCCCLIIIVRVDER